MEEAEVIWAEKNDDELVEASGELFDYTEEGERIIRAELRRRGLPEPDPPIGKCSRCGRSIASNHPGDRCSECEEPFPPEILRKVGDQASSEPNLMSVLQTGDTGLASLAKSMLDEEGIEHLIQGKGLRDPFDGGRAGGGGFGGGPVEFWVHEEDEERARTLLDGLGMQPADEDSGGESARLREDSLRKQLIGHWSLVSLAAVDGSDIEYPMGQDVEGVITYDQTEHMAVQIMRHDRPRFVSGDMDRGTPAEMSAAITGYTAYFGTYSVDESAAVVTHHIRGSLLPNWVGTDQRREVAFDGDRLTLTSQPILFEGKMRVFRVIWKRDS
jgi:Lipocalin-like domain/Putative prokaryotic signal transducing protein